MGVCNVSGVQESSTRTSATPSTRTPPAAKFSTASIALVVSLGLRRQRAAIVSGAPLAATSRISLKGCAQAWITAIRSRLTP